MKVSDLIGLLEFHIALSEILLTSGADHLLCNLGLTKLCLENVKQNTAADACLLWAK